MSNNVTRQDLYDLTHKELGISKNECINLQIHFETLAKNFEEGNKVKISLFGSLMLNKKIKNWKKSKNFRDKRDIFKKSNNI